MSAWGERSWGFNRWGGEASTTVRLGAVWGERGWGEGAWGANGISVAGTGAVGTVLEYWTYLSQASDVKGSDGSTLYYKDVINAGSEWVFIGNAPAALSESGNNAAGETFVTAASFFANLTGGVDLSLIHI